MKRRRLSLFLLLSLCPWISFPARSEWLPGESRAIGAGLSASRDAPVLEAAYGPRAQTSVGMEQGLWAGKTAHFRWHAGLWGLIALENRDNAQVFPAFELWRGLVGVYGAAAYQDWAELGFGLGHESDHSTDRPNPEPPLAGDLKNGGAGNWMFVEPVLRWRAWTASVQGRLYGEGDFSHGALADLRVAPGSGVRPFASLHAEALAAREAGVRGCRRLRLLLGVELPGRRGALAAFVSLSSGNGYGVRVNLRETRLSAGVRLSPF